MNGVITARTAVLLAALTTVLVGTVRKDGYFADPAGLSWWYAAAWLLFAAAAWSVRKVPVRHAVLLIVAGGVAVAATGLAAPPRTSTDSYRYVWDGRVQAAGISPYDHAPADPALTSLRDPWLFPTGDACAGPARARITTDEGGRHCTRLNRPKAHTIYPPVAQGYFLLVHALSPEGARHKPLQVGGALLALGVTGALLLALRRHQGDLRGAAYWAWCPAVPVEAVNNAHADVLGVLLAIARLTMVVRHRAAGGALLGAATAVKLLPAVVLPGALSGVLARPIRWRAAAAVLLPAAGVLALCYLPYVLASQQSVFGYLGDYVAEEGYDNAAAENRYAVLRLLLPDTWALPVVCAVMAVTAWHVLRHGDPDRPWRGALLVTGAAFLLMTPGYSWYALLLIALVALDGRWEWLGVAVAGAAAYVTSRAFDDPRATSVMVTAVYAGAAALVLVGWAVRRGTPTSRTPSGDHPRDPAQFQEQN
ncbi:glycosyltransferase 87 family protein [Streptomyces sp. H27-C3]|uniref:glycosyltransferase 87 family protein n=1 Tax=Streptomyces sp. H27-C3 TaxID=3046305 RepID=UPI0024BAE052|nr:glycosyltransferase 87 family protein [Streptomyces sp. H27-C3]MDJ0466648.1 glycosyltransferase 87 family protein [Streptomyces sp. H27-C3]